MEMPTIEWLEMNCRNEPVQQKDSLHYPFLYGPYAFGITTIEPGNDIHILLDFFERDADFPLVICGNWMNNAYAEALFLQYAQKQSVHLLEPITNRRTFNMLRSNCHVYIEPTRLTNTQSYLYEAMYMQLPIVAYASPENIYTTSNKAIYYKSTADLQRALKSIHALKKVELGIGLRKELNKLIES